MVNQKTAMNAKRLTVGAAVLLHFVCLVGLPSFGVAAPSPQEPQFELPVQLIGFPILVAAVRLSNFVKKLAYSLNPRTYTSRTRRSLSLPEPPLNVAAVEKRLIAELGEHVCVFEQVCDQYAEHARTLRGSNHVMNWEQVFNGYEQFPAKEKRNYLLSVFLGDIVASPGLCHQLAKRGRGCGGNPPAQGTRSRGTGKFKSTE